MKESVSACYEFAQAQVTWSEEESVPRQGRGGPSGHGWLKRLSDLTMLPAR